MLSWVPSRRLRSVLCAAATAIAALGFAPSAGATPMLDPCAAGDCALVGVFSGNDLAPGPDKSTILDASAGMDVHLIPVGAGNEFSAGDLGTTVGVFTVTDDGDGLSGTWAISSGSVEFLSIKAGNTYALYRYLPAASSGLWSTAALAVGSGNQPALSHMTFWRPVPEPGGLAAWAAGLAALGVARRRRGSP